MELVNGQVTHVQVLVFVFVEADFLPFFEVFFSMFRLQQVVAAFVVDLQVGGEDVVLDFTGTVVDLAEQ